ncbi:MAG TPA: hypothetical protein VEF34_16930 [Syntrophobacteraceae bacterium]|nr:hypothetical protein [Syntrophobacteraceae bacterium]
MAWSVPKYLLLSFIVSLYDIILLEKSPNYPVWKIGSATGISLSESGLLVLLIRN